MVSKISSMVSIPDDHSLMSTTLAKNQSHFFGLKELKSLEDQKLNLYDCISTHITQNQDLSFHKLWIASAILFALLGESMILIIGMSGQGNLRARLTLECMLCSVPVGCRVLDHILQTIPTMGAGLCAHQYPWTQEVSSFFTSSVDPISQGTSPSYARVFAAISQQGELVFFSSQRLLRQFLQAILKLGCVTKFYVH